MTFNCMIAGVGGQGTVLASKLIAAAAIKKGFDVRTTETIGMAQRGGSVFGHVRIGDHVGDLVGENIFSPIIPVGGADALIGFEPAETARQLRFLHDNGAVIVYDGGNGDMIQYLRESVQKLVVIEGCRLTGHSVKTLNVFLLGAAVQSGILPFDAEIIRTVLKETLPERFLEMNLKAFEGGLYGHAGAD
jgi:indolepyruvate ferredoxin oxidoreductase, beta subunit